MNFSNFSFIVHTFVRSLLYSTLFHANCFTWRILSMHFLLILLMLRIATVFCKYPHVLLHLFVYFRFCTFSFSDSNHVSIFLRHLPNMLYYLYFCLFIFKHISLNKTMLIHLHDTCLLTIACEFYMEYSLHEHDPFLALSYDIKDSTIT